MQQGTVKVKEKQLFILTRYSALSVRVLGRPDANGKQIKYQCGFRNGIYRTENPKEATALRDGDWFGIDYISDKVVSQEAKTAMVMKDEFGDDAGLVGKLRTKYKRQDLIKLAGKVKRPSDNMKDFIKMKNVDLIDFIVSQKHKIGEV